MAGIENEMLKLFGAWLIFFGGKHTNNKYNSVTHQRIKQLLQAHNTYSILIQGC